MDGSSSRGPAPGREPTDPNGMARVGHRLPDRRQRVAGCRTTTSYPCICCAPGRPTRRRRPVSSCPSPAAGSRHTSPPNCGTRTRTGGGTPFAAFSAAEPGPRPDADRDLPAEFLEGSRRARRDTRRRPRRPDSRPD